MSDTLLTAMQGMVEAALAEVNTAVPGVIVSYDPGSNRAVVRAALPKRLADDTVLAAPQIVSVPVVWPSADVGGRQAALTFPLKAGDGVLLHFSQRSLETWLSGGSGAPDDPRMFDLTDAIATPGLNAGGVAGDGSDVVLRHGVGEVRLQPDGTAIIANENSSIMLRPNGVIELNAILVRINAPIEAGDTEGGGATAHFLGSIVAEGEVVAMDSVALSTHRHSGVDPGSGQSGGPVSGT